MTSPKDDAAQIKQIKTWILEGARADAITESILEAWPDSDSQPLIVDAFQQMQRDAEATRSTANAWAIEATKHVYHRCIECGEFGAAMRAIKQIVDLTGKQTNTSEADTPNFGVLTDDNFTDLRERLASRIAAISQNDGRLSCVAIVSRRSRTGAGDAEV